MEFLAILTLFTSLASSHSHPPRDQSGVTPRSSGLSQYTPLFSRSTPNPCNGYDTPFLDSVTSLFPATDGSIATLVKGDKVALGLYNQMLANETIASALKYAPHGSADGNGNFKGDTYDYDTDKECWWTDSTCVVPKAAWLPPDFSACPEPRTWGLTFDDGPNCANALLYDFLAKEKLKATLFYIGANVMAFPVQAQGGVQGGHEVCVHTWSHHYTASLTNEQVFAELYYTKKIIKDITGLDSNCWRPPYGDVDDRVRTIAQFLNLQTYLWNHDTFDWSYDDAGVGKAVIDANYAKIFANASDTGGIIVLTHEVLVDSMQEFINQYPNIIKHFDHLMPAGVCMNVTHPYAQQNITFPTFAQYISGSIEPTTQTTYFSNASIILEDVGVPVAANTTTSGSSPGSGKAPSGSAPASGSTSTTSSAAVGSGTSKPGSSGAVGLSAGNAVWGLVGGVVMGMMVI